MTDWLTTSEVARALECSEATVRSMANRGELECHQTKAGRIFDTVDVEKWKKAKVTRA